VLSIFKALSLVTRSLLASENSALAFWMISSAVVFFGVYEILPGFMGLGFRV
jgi:hypothetical protein